VSPGGIRGNTYETAFGLSLISVGICFRPLLHQCASNPATRSHIAVGVSSCQNLAVSVWNGVRTVLVVRPKAMTPVLRLRFEDLDGQPN